MNLSEESIADRLRTLVVRRNGGRNAPADVVLVGLVGRGIQSSRTPAMHEREGGRLGIPYTYVLIDFDALGLPDEALANVLVAARAAGFAGLNVTHPFKQRVIPLLTALEPQAEAIGAANTVVFGKNSAITGYNTDSWGFAASFAKSMASCPLDQAVQFGAGGAGAAVANALLDLGVTDLAIVDNDAAKARDLADRFSARFGGRIRAASPKAELVGAASGIVNTTPVGMAKYPGVPFPADWLDRRQWVAEIIYFPKETELLRHARALGCRVLPGTGMAIYQAVRAFELFTGATADPASMIRHFEIA